MNCALWGQKWNNNAHGVDIVRLAPKMVPHGPKMHLELSNKNEIRGMVAVLGAHATMDIYIYIYVFYIYIYILV